MSADKTQLVLDAAQAQFLRYGFRRVTMGDIAQAASMSRPALYLLFPNKEAIFSAVFTRFVDASLAQIEAGIHAHETLADQLAFAVDIWTVRPYELLHHTPEGRELTDCSYDFAADLVRDSYARFEAILAAVLEPWIGAGPQAPAAPAVAEVFSLALRGIKAGAEDAPHLQSLVNNLIHVTTAALNSAAERTTATAATAAAN